ncbi:MAG: GTP cyclohydrolase II [Pseudomonadota bacterium]
MDRATGELRRGAAVLLHDSRGVASLTFAAETVDEVTLRRARDLARDLPLLAVTDERAAALGLARAASPVSVIQLPPGVTASTIQRLADPTSERPQSQPGGLSRSDDPTGFASAAIHLAKLARLLPAVLICPLGELTLREREMLAESQDLLELGIEAINAYEAAAARSLSIVGEARVPLEGAESTRIVAFRPSDGGLEHLAIVIGDPRRDQPVLTRLHSECFTGDLLGSLRCDCGDQLRGAIAEIAKQGDGLLIYLSQEGRGSGVVNTLRAYRLQDSGADTIEANQQLGFDADERVYLPAAEMLRLLGFGEVRLMTNNPAKVDGLLRCGIVVTKRVPQVFPANRHNDRYLETKASRFGHLL